MKLSNLTVQQKFILKLLAENPTFSLKKRGVQIWMCDGNYPLFCILKRTYDNLETLNLL